MVGAIFEHKDGYQVALLQAGPAWLCKEVKTVPQKGTSVLDIILTDKGQMYVHPGLSFGVFEMKTIAMLEDPAQITLSLLADEKVAHFVMKIVHQWANLDSPSWANESTEDLLNYFRWMTGRVDSLTRSTRSPC